MPPLSKPEAEEIAAAICAEYHRTLNPDVLAVLTAKQTDGEAACGNPLWLELALEELNLLDEDDFRRVKQFKGRPDQQLHQLLLSVADEMPADIEGMYGWLLQKTEEVWGEAWARGFANLIAVSRAGWREVDLERLLPVVSGEKWDPGRFAGLRRSFRAHLVQRGLQGQWDFFHAQARHAVLTRNLPDPIHLHSLIADHLLALADDDPLRETETMFHLVRADDRLRAAKYYAGDLADGALAGATRALAEHIIAAADQDPSPELEWAASLLGTQGLSPDEIGPLCHRFLFDLTDELSRHPHLTPRLVLLQRTRSSLSKLVETQPTNAERQRDLSANHDAIGGVLRARGDLRGAEDAYRVALATFERLAASDATNLAWQRDLSVIHQRIGGVLMTRGDLAGAMEEFRAALAIFESLAASDATNVEWQRDLSVTHQRIGDVLMTRGDVAGAMEEYRADLAILKRLAAAEPTNAQWQRDLSVTREKIGDVLEARRDLKGAEAAYRTALAIRERLAAAEPTNADWQRDLSVSQDRIGDVLADRGDLQAAEEAYRASRGISERLAALEPTNADWQHDLLCSHERTADVLSARGDTLGAMEEYRAVAAMCERLIASDPTNTLWQRALSVNHGNIAHALLVQGDLAGAMEEDRASQAIIERLAASDPTNAVWQRGLFGSHFALSMDWLLRGRLVRSLRSLNLARSTLLRMRRRRMSLDAPARIVFWGLTALSFGGAVGMSALGWSLARRGTWGLIPGALLLGLGAWRLFKTVWEPH